MGEYSYFLKLLNDDRHLQQKLMMAEQPNLLTLKSRNQRPCLDIDQGIMDNPPLNDNVYVLV